jgi:hypothetical protein
MPPRKRANPYAGRGGGVLRIAPPDRTSGPSIAVTDPPAHIRASERPSAQAGAPPSGVVQIEGRRADAPVMRSYGRGNRGAALDIASSHSLRAAALSALEEAEYALSSRSTRASHAALWNDILRSAGLDHRHLSVHTYRTGVSILRAAGYRSASQIAEQAVDTARTAGQPIGEDLKRAVQRGRRACLRGLGPPRHTAAFPVDQIVKLTSGEAPLVPDGPAWPCRLLVVGSWWLTREVELGNSALGDACLADGVASINLPASKTDFEALGATRSHSCACGRGNGAPALLAPSICPACTLAEQVAWAKSRGYRNSDALFPTASGAFPSKASIIATIEAAAELLRLPLVAPSGARLWGGHALRRGGAQYLARSGVEVWRVQALARHSTGVILTYIENAHIGTLTSIAQEAAAGRTIEVVRCELQAMQAEVARGRTQRDELRTQVQQLLAPAPNMPAIVVPVEDLAPPALVPPPGPQEARPEARFILGLRSHGRLHRRHRKLLGLTKCGWAWARCGAAAPSADRLGAQPCALCFPESSGGNSEDSTTSSSSSLRGL